jgi:hypothetical protein
MPSLERPFDHFAKPTQRSKSKDKDKKKYESVSSVERNFTVEPSINETLQRLRS